MMYHEAATFSDILLTDAANLQKEDYYYFCFFYWSKIIIETQAGQPILRCIVLAHVDSLPIT